MTSDFIKLSETNYVDFVKENDGLVVFYKNRCPNCKVLMKVMEKCLAGHPDIKMAEVDTEENSNLLEDLQILRVPTILVYKGGGIKARKTGVMKPVELTSLYYDA